jgi:D-3-phosphoglycerate dehydrogenase / 2-oxoglutarate reductase
MRILFADTFVEEWLPHVEAAGHECVVRPDLGADDLPAAVTDVDVLIVRSTRVTAATLGSGERLGLVIRAGAGVNTIDLDAAAERGIYVCNVPGKNAIAVAELAFGLLLALDRQIPDAVADLRAGVWNKKRYARGRGLAGRAVGVVGLGEIGLAFAERAAGFAMRVLAVDKPGRSPETVARIEELGIELVPDLPTLAASCDALSFHVPAGPDTTGLIGRDLLAHCRDGAYIVNTSRGDLVDDEALLAAFDAKGLRAGLDVFNGEPGSGEGTISSPLARHPNVYGTHHIGASTEQAQSAIAEEVVRMVQAFEEGTVLHCVNLETRPLGEAVLTVRHHDEVGVLSDVLGVLRKAELNVEQMENRVFAGARAACATIQVSGEVPDDLESQLAQVERVLHVGVRPCRGADAESEG